MTGRHTRLDIDGAGFAAEVAAFADALGPAPAPEPPQPDPDPDPDLPVDAAPPEPPEPSWGDLLAGGGG